MADRGGRGRGDRGRGAGGGGRGAGGGDRGRGGGGDRGRGRGDFGGGGDRGRGRGDFGGGDRGRGRGDFGGDRGGRGGDRGRGGGGRGRGLGQTVYQPNFPIPRAPTFANTNVTIAGHVTSIGAKRPSYGAVGKPVALWTNNFRATPPTKIIYHYDVSFGGKKVLPARLNMEIISALQNRVATSIFTPRGVYDGRANFYAPRRLPFGESDAREFRVGRDAQVDVETETRGVDVVRMKLVATINPTSLSGFIVGEQSHDVPVLTALNACNVAMRMQPTQQYPFNTRSFFTDDETRHIGRGITLWRGYFQSARPAVNSLVINIDISTGAMYKTGPLIDLCLDFFGRPNQNPASLLDKNMPARQRNELSKFLNNVRFTVKHLPNRARSIKGLSKTGADEEMFQKDDGTMSSVAQYFAGLRIRLTYPKLLCVKVGAKALIPIELCHVPPGQMMRRQIPSDLTSSVLDFSSSHPSERIAKIVQGLTVLGYDQSEYLRSFGITVESQPMTVQGRILPTPSLEYGGKSTVQPANGAWNMRGKTLYAPSKIGGYCIIVYEQQTRFPQSAVDSVHQGLMEAATSLKMQVPTIKPHVVYKDGMGDLGQHIQATAAEYNTRHKTGFPNLMVFILPESNTDLYIQLKHWCDIRIGVASQCLRASKCARANIQYYANVCLKINVKLGGVNSIARESAKFLTDPVKPCLVLGADVAHPAPGAEGRPSFAALVGNVDSNSSRYVATSRAQRSRVEMIADLEPMTGHILKMYSEYRKNVEKKQSLWPAHILYFRDGVSEGQFAQVLNDEVPLIMNACKAVKMPTPKLTVIVVGKRHHNRFFPQKTEDADNSGNAPAGTVIDRDITSPIEYDYFLQSHGGLLGTSRSAHYSVLMDQIGFAPDKLQQISFALCHLFARATRSVSIPAPVYYADIVCDRAKTHYSPDNARDMSETMSQLSGTQGELEVERYLQNYLPVHANMARVMYFS